MNPVETDCDEGLQVTTDYDIKRQYRAAEIIFLFGKRTPDTLWQLWNDGMRWYGIGKRGIWYWVSTPCIWYGGHIEVFTLPTIFHMEWVDSILMPWTGHGPFFGWWPSHFFIPCLLWSPHQIPWKNSLNGLSKILPTSEIKHSTLLICQMHKHESILTAGLWSC